MCNQMPYLFKEIGWVSGYRCSPCEIFTVILLYRLELSHINMQQRIKEGRLQKREYLKYKHQRSER